MRAIPQPPTIGVPPTSEARYDGVGRALHWLVFGLVFVQFLLGWTMPEIERNATQQGLADWHLSIGAALMFLVALRLLWRVAHPVPLARP